MNKPERIAEVLAEGLFHMDAPILVGNGLMRRFLLLCRKNAQAGDSA